MTIRISKHTAVSLACACLTASVVWAGRLATHFNSGLPAGTRRRKLIKGSATATFCCLMLGSAWAQTTNLLINGDFELPVLNAGAYQSLPPASTNLFGWTVDDTPSDGIQFAAAGVFGRSSGSQYVQLTGGVGYGPGGGIRQTIPTTPGVQYIISLSVASRQGGAIEGQITFGGTNIPISFTGTTFPTLSWAATATDSSTLVDITGNPVSTSQQLLIDNATVFLGVPAAILLGPTNTTVFSSQTASFYMNCTGTPPIWVQWYSNNIVVSGSALTAGATGSTYTTPATTLANNGDVYKVAISNVISGGLVFSTNATLTVNAGVLVTSVGTSGQTNKVTVIFTRPVQNIGTYTIPGLTVFSQAYGATQNQVVLTTSPMPPDTTYTLTIAGEKSTDVPAQALAPTDPLSISFRQGGGAFCTTFIP
jgi:hypothetical protein